MDYEKDILILSGEGEQGTWERYFGKRTDRAIKSRITRERSGGDRWASAWIHQYDNVYARLDDNMALTEMCEVPASAIHENPAAALGAMRSEKKAASSRENGKKGGRPSITKIEEALDIRTEKQGTINGVLRYKVWRCEDNAYIFDGSYTYKELKEEAGI